MSCILCILYYYRHLCTFNLFLEVGIPIIGNPIISECPLQFLNLIAEKFKSVKLISEFAVRDYIVLVLLVKR